MLNAFSRLLVPSFQSIKLQNRWPPLTSAPLPTLSSLFPRFLFSILLRSLGPPSRLRQANFYFDCSPCRTSPLFEQCSVLPRSFLPRSLFTFASKHSSPTTTSWGIHTLWCWPSSVPQRWQLHSLSLHAHMDTLPQLVIHRKAVATSQITCNRSHLTLLSLPTHHNQVHLVKAWASFPPVL